MKRLDDIEIQKLEDEIERTIDVCLNCHALGLQNKIQIELELRILDKLNEQLYGAMK